MQAVAYCWGLQQQSDPAHLVWELKVTLLLLLHLQHLGSGALGSWLMLEAAACCQLALCKQH